MKNAYKSGEIRGIHEMHILARCESNNSYSEQAYEGRPCCNNCPARVSFAPANQLEGTVMKEIGKKIYHKIPTCLRWLFWPVKMAFKFVDISRLDLWILSGEEITSHQKLSIFYAGTEIHRNYFSKMAYGNSFSENYFGRVWIWKIFKALKEKGHNCSLMIVAVDKLLWRFLAKWAYFSIPFWVLTIVDISVDISLLTKSKSVKSDINKIRNNRLSFEITQAPSQFDNFYYNMYRPYTAAAHGDVAIILEYDYMKRQFKNSELLLIKKGNEYIAGTLLVYKKKRGHPAYLGVKDGNFDYVKDGAIAAIFLFAICLFKEKGYQQLDLGLSRAFLKDGVLRYKKKWGGSRIAYSSLVDGIYFVEPLSNTPGLKAFFINNPFVFIDKRKINGVIFVDGNHSFSREELEEIYKQYYFNGMSELSIYQFGKDSARTQKILSLQSSDKIRFRSADHLFQKRH